MALPAVAGVALAMMQGSAGSLSAEVRDRFTATAADRMRAALALAAGPALATSAPGRLMIELISTVDLSSYSDTAGTPP